jgi:hypothetical protein
MKNIKYEQKESREFWLTPDIVFGVNFPYEEACAIVEAIRTFKYRNPQWSEFSVSEKYSEPGKYSVIGVLKSDKQKLQQLLAGKIQEHKFFVIYEI